MLLPVQEAHVSSSRFPLAHTPSGPYTLSLWTLLLPLPSFIVHLLQQLPPLDFLLKQQET